jgi:hypothetical protein
MGAEQWGERWGGSMVTHKGDIHMLKKQKFPLPLNLQFFAEDPPPTGGAPQTPPAPPVPPAGGTTPTFTKEEVDKEIDRRVNKFVEENSNLKKQLDEFNRQLDELKKNAMTDKERADYEKQQQEAERQRLEQELADREMKLKDRENRLIVRDKLDEAKLPQKLADFVLADTEEAITERITTLKSMIDESVKAEVEATFKNHSGDPGGSAGTGGSSENPWSKEHYNLTEQGKLFREDPERARQMAAQHGYKI